ncbi:VCBS repeat-containing protein [Salegentibacter sp. HM20]
MRLISIFLVFLIFVSCSREEDKQPLGFEYLTAEVTNIKFSNDLSPTPALNILDYLYFYNGGGVAVGDINNDGLPDIYFSGNQVKNKLFLNKGNMQFEDITQTAGVAGTSDWNTGVTMADVNGDGYLDIYVCAVVGVNGLGGKNELFINNGDGTFTEAAADYGLDFQNYSSTAAFFDFDNDGDLDMYLLNHAVHTVNTYGPASLRDNRHPASGDKLLRNDNGKFIDISEEAGIYGGANGYGLGIATADFNNNGFTDIYVSNDFHEDDYYYLNNGDGTFSEQVKEKFGHLSRFSMGSDATDITGNAYPDLITLDMLPQDEKVLKASVGDDPRDLDALKIERLGYHHQYTRNMLQINREGKYFQEAGLYSGLAATDWSWSALFADFDQDGQQDIFISTGIPKRPNDLDYIKYVSSDQIRNKINNTRLVDQKALDMMPSGNVPNYIFKGKGNIRFDDLSQSWISQDSIISTGTAWADLDNDGDLDLIVNNINAPAGIYKNNIEDKGAWIKLKFDHPAPNTFGVGTKVITWNNGQKQLKQLFPTRGFQSSSEPVLHFGFGNIKNLDSISIIWPDQTYQVIKNPDLNSSHLLKPETNLPRVDYAKLLPGKNPVFTKLDSLPGVDFVHRENRYIDFDRHKLIPYRISDRGPAILVTDLNGDGKDDLFFGNSKFNSSKIYLQKAETFEIGHYPEITKDSIFEESIALAVDFNAEGRTGIFLGSAGGEFASGNRALKDRFFYKVGEIFKEVDNPGLAENSSFAIAEDFTGNTYPDIFVGTGANSNDFGKTSASYFLKNNKGDFQFEEQEVFENLGMLSAGVASDFNGDGEKDLILVGQWMSPKFLKNKGGKFTDVTSQIIPEGLKGLWQSIIPFDINGDGKMDYLLGNWGQNTKFRASAKYPLKMYLADFDDNGKTESIVAYEKDEKYYPINGLDKLAAQLPFLKKKFPEYKGFAGKSIEEIFSKEQLEKAQIMEVEELSSGYLLNTGGKFIFKPFKASLQMAPITHFIKADFLGNSNEEVLAAGNFFGVTPYHGRFDALAGNLIISEDEIMEGSELGLDLSQKQVSGLQILEFNGKKVLVVGINNSKPEFYEIKN